MRLLRLRLLATFSAAMLLAPLAGAQAASGQVTAPRSVTQASATDPSVPQPDQPTSPLVPLREGGTADAPAMAAASARARSTGKPVRVNTLTTSTSITVAEPHGGFAFQERVLPVRVRRGSGWVPVNTSLRRHPDGTFSPVAVPGDTVTFSGGGTRPLATIGSGTASLQVSWPEPPPGAGTVRVIPHLPRRAARREPGGDGHGGGSRRLLRDPGREGRRRGPRSWLAAAGDGRGRPPGGPGDGRTRRGTGGPVVWSAGGIHRCAAGDVGLSVRQAGKPGHGDGRASARKVGGWPAPPGLGPASSPAGPASGAVVARVGDPLTAGHWGVALIPDQAMLTSRSTKFPVFIDPPWTQDTTNTQHYDEVQSACPTASHYDTTDSAYWSLGAELRRLRRLQWRQRHRHAYYQVYVPNEGSTAHTSIRQPWTRRKHIPPPARRRAA